MLFLRCRRSVDETFRARFARRRRGLSRKRTSHMTLERAEQLRKIFGLRTLPRRMPYDAKIGLDLPDYLTDKEIRRILCAVATPLVKDSPWYTGDLMLWLQAQPDPRSPKIG